MSTPHTVYARIPGLLSFLLLMYETCVSALRRPAGARSLRTFVTAKAPTPSASLAEIAPISITALSATRVFPAIAYLGCSFPYPTSSFSYLHYHGEDLLRSLLFLPPHPLILSTGLTEYSAYRPHQRLSAQPAHVELACSGGGVAGVLDPTRRLNYVVSIAYLYILASSCTIRGVYITKKL